jgi:hypothetical protein
LCKAVDLKTIDQITALGYDLNIVEIPGFMKAAAAPGRLSILLN